MNITPELIGWIITGVFGLFILFGFLWGIKRGLRKTTFRFIWLFVTVVLLVIFSGIISKALIHMDVSFMNLSYDGNPCPSLYSYAKAFIENNETIKAYIPNPETITSLAETLPILIGNLLVFVLLFWLAKILLWPIWAIIAKRISRNQKVYSEKKRIKKNIPATYVPKPKRRWWGGLVGVACGILVAVSTFMPIIGVSSMIVKIDKSTASAASSTSENKGLITELLGEDANDILPFIYVYENSAIGKVFKYTGINAATGLMFDLVGSADLNGERIVLSSELTRVARVAGYGIKISELDFDNLTQENLDDLFEYVKVMVTDVFNSGVVKSMFDEIVPDVINSILNDDEYEVKIPEVDGYPAIKSNLEDMLESISGISAKRVCGDVIKFIEAIEMFNDKGMVYDLYKGDMDAFETKLKALDDNFAKKFVDKFFDMYVLKNIAPISVNMGVEILWQTLDMPAEDFVKNETSQTIAALKDLFKKIFVNSLEVYKTISDDNLTIISTTVFKNVGIVLDGLLSGSLMSDEVYEALKDKAEELAKEAIDGIEASELTSSLKNVLKDAVTATFTLLDDEDFSFENEFAIFGNVAQMVIDYEDEHPDIESWPLSKFGEWMDVLSTSKLFTTVYDNALDAAADFGIDKINEMLEEMASEEETPFVITKKHGDVPGDLDFLIEALQDITDDNTDNEWTNEFTQIDKIYQAIKELKEENGDIYDQLNMVIGEGENQTTILENIGAALDSASANGSKVFNIANITELVQLVLDKISLPEELEIEISPANGATPSVMLIEQLKANVGTITSFEDEFGYIVRVLNEIEAGNIDLETIDLASLGEIIDDIQDSKLLTGIIKPVIKSFIQDFIDEEDFDAELESILLEVKANIDNITSYQTELGFVDDVLDIDFENIDFATIGQTFNSLKTSAVFGGDVLVRMVRYGIDVAFDDDEDFNIVITEAVGTTPAVKLKDQLKANVTSTMNFETEFSFIDNIININFASIDMTTIGETFNSMKTKTLFAGCTVPLVKFGIVQAMSDSADYNIVISGTTKLKDQLKANVTASMDFDVEFTFVKQIMDINFASIDMTTIGETFNAMKTKALFAGCTVPLVKYGIDRALSDSADYNIVISGTTKLKDQLKANVTASMDFDVEFTFVKQLMDTNFNTIVYTGENSIGKTFDTMKTIALFAGCTVPLVKYGIDKGLTAITDTEMRTAIADIKDNVQAVCDSTTTNFDREFGYIGGLVTGFNFSTATLPQIGAKLDGLKPSLLFSGVITNMVECKIDSIEAGEYASVMAEIKGNVANMGDLDNYATEFIYLQAVKTFIDDTTKTNEEFDAMLDTIRGDDDISDSVLIDEAVIDAIVDIYSA